VEHDCGNLGEEGGVQDVEAWVKGLAFTGSIPSALEGVDGRADIAVRVHGDVGESTTLPDGNG
jgi:hypothetical protein